MVCSFPSSEYASLLSPPGTPSRKGSALPVPSSSTLSHPIRQYISGTLTCHVLGQPSYSLTCLLVSAVLQFLDIPIYFDKPVTIEDICKQVRLPTCQPVAFSFLLPVITTGMCVVALLFSFTTSSPCFSCFPYHPLQHSASLLLCRQTTTSSQCCLTQSSSTPEPSLLSTMWHGGSGISASE